MSPLEPVSSRRSFLKKGLIGGAVLAVGGIGLSLRPSKLVEPQEPLAFFTEKEFSVFSAIADRVIPERKGWPTTKQLKVAEKADKVLLKAHEGAGKELKQLLGIFESALAGLAFDLSPTPFTQRSPEDQDRTLLAWQNSAITIRRTGYKALKNLACAVYYASPETYPLVGYPGPPEVGPLAPKIPGDGAKQEGG